MGAVAWSQQMFLTPERRWLTGALRAPLPRLECAALCRSQRSAWVTVACAGAPIVISTDAPVQVSCAARIPDSGAFRILDGETGSINPCAPLGPASRCPSAQGNEKAPAYRLNPGRRTSGQQL